jgi:hypothetical protein
MEEMFLENRGATSQDSARQDLQDLVVFKKCKPGATNLKPKS